MSDKPTWTTEKRKLGDLREWDRNPRELSEHDAKHLARSIEKFNLADPLVINLDGQIVGGHQRKRVMLATGYTAADMVDVRVPSRPLTEREAEELNIRLNRNSGAWNWDTLADQFEIADLLDWGFTDFDLEMHDLAEEPEPAADPGAQLDKAAELQEKWGVERGQVWEVGLHRIMCGDSTCAEDVARLMAGDEASAIVTDPPFNVGFDYKTGFDDKREVDEYGAWLWSVMEDWERRLTMPWRVFMWQAMLTAPYWGRWIPRQFRLFANVEGWVQYLPTPIQFSWDAVLFWADGQSAVVPQAGRRDYFVSKPSHQQGHGGSAHPCPRPLDAVRYMLDELSEPGAVLDPFLGSGTTIVACEQTGRRGFGMEISPAYVSVSLQRLQDMGLEPRLAE